IKHAVSVIATIKAFNVATHEIRVLAHALGRISAAGNGLTGIWGLTSGFSQFITMAMFMQGFWFGAHLVREGKNTPGQVMSVFWACLISTSNLQMA
ncbi:uncharacterized protein EDB91DRAFT_1010013, partial [Suillus paluster]|uniref:uncharacterized protein n=1 Tax=Suillus paluster TaxID=48578 RepID=UPI001B877914